MDESEGLSLDEYVAQTLIAIVGGVIKAQADEVCGAYLGRSFTFRGELPNIAKDSDDNVITLVSFDVATTVEDKTGRGAGLAIKVIPALSAEAKGSKEQRASAVSRIAFSVPVSIPKPLAQRESDEAARLQRARAVQRSIDRM